MQLAELRADFAALLHKGAALSRRFRALLLQCRALRGNFFTIRELLQCCVDLRKALIALLDPRVDLRKALLCLRDAAFKLRAHFVERRVGGCGSIFIAAAKLVDDRPAGHAGVVRIVLQRARHGIAQCVELLLSLVQLFLAGFQLVRTVGKLLRALFIVLHAVGIVLLTLFIVAHSLIVFLHAVGVFLLAVLQLGLGIVELHTRIGKLLLAVIVFLPAVVELPARIGKLLARVAELFVGLRLGVVQLLLRIVELFRRFVHKLVVAQARAPLAEVLERVDHIVNIIIVFIVKRGHLRCVRNADIGRRIIVERERLARQVEIRLHRAAAERRRAALHRKVHRRAHRADHRVGVLRERIGKVVPRRERDRITDGNAHQREHIFLHHALVRTLGHAPLAQQHIADAAIREGEDLHHRIERIGRGKRVDDVFALGILDLILRAQRGNILIGQAKGRKHLNVG